MHPDGAAGQPEDPVGHRVERAAPHAAGIRAAHEPARPSEHLAGGSPREREQQDAFRGHATGEKVGHAAREREGLAGPGARHHQQGGAAMGDRFALGRIQAVEPVLRLIEHVFG